MNLKIEIDMVSIVTAMTYVLKLNKSRVERIKSFEDKLILIGYNKFTSYSRNILQSF